MIKATFLAVNGLFLCMFHHGGCGSVPEPYEEMFIYYFGSLSLLRDGIVVTAAYLEDADANMVEEKAQEGERVY